MVDAGDLFPKTQEPQQPKWANNQTRLAIGQLHEMIINLTSDMIDMEARFDKLDAAVADMRAMLGKDTIPDE